MYDLYRCRRCGRLNWMYVIGFLQCIRPHPTTAKITCAGELRRAEPELRVIVDAAFRLGGSQAVHDILVAEDAKDLNGG